MLLDGMIAEAPMQNEPLIRLNGQARSWDANPNPGQTKLSKRISLEDRYSYQVTSPILRIGPPDPKMWRVQYRRASGHPAYTADGLYCKNRAIVPLAILLGSVFLPNGLASAGEPIC